MATKQKKENYQTVGERVLEALAKLNFEENTAAKRNLRALSERYYRIMLNQKYDKDTTPHKISTFCVENLHMDYQDFTPQNIINKNRILFDNLGLKKPEKNV